MTAHPRAAARALPAAIAVLSLAAYIGAFARSGEPLGLATWAGYSVVGWYILQVRPGNRIGWVMLGIGACWALKSLSITSLFLPLVLVGSVAGYQGFILFLVLILVFPTGRTSTRLGRLGLGMAMGVAVLLMAVSLVGPTLGDSGPRNPLAVESVRPFAETFIDQGFLVVPVIACVAGIDAIRRWRRATGVERLQLRWFAWALCLVVLGFLSWGLVPNPPPLLEWPQALFPNLIPLSIGVAITRHSLYSIDRVVSRTVSYALVTLVVVGTYAVVVTSVSRLLPDSGALPVAGATLAAAGVCLPVLRRVRGWVDRRFDRARFDAQQQVEAFAARMGTVVDADDVTADLAGTVQQTLAPATVGVWVGGAR